MSNKVKNMRSWLLMLFAAISLGVSAQTITVKGNVKDTTGEPIIGASVVEKGNTTNGTITDLDGNYSIKVPSKATLTISYIGMKTQDIAVKGQSQINVTLSDDTQALDEVVVIGYGTVAKKDLTGSVSSVSAKQIAAIPVSSASEALQGKMAGVSITTTEGSPDADVKIRVRGGGSLSQDNSPLYIVDGFPVSSISDIAPTDIQSVDVLKDASSTAIYGARGANGVIIITTKSGQEGKIQVNLGASFGVRKVTKMVDVLNPYEYVLWQQEIDQEGMNPDSFARKHNSTEFQQFIQEHETDFIRFKTNLLLEDAGKDPIKRAELIGNLVQSISVIPEAIVRDVYIKECAQLLRVEDKLLVSEVAKRREMQAEKRAEQAERERRNAGRQAESTQNVTGAESSTPAAPTTADATPTAAGEAPGHNANAPFPPEDSYISFIPQEGKEGQEFYKYERLILQMIVRYGEKVMCNVTNEEGQEIPVSVIEYVVSDLKQDELSFHNPLHRQILTEAAAHIHDAGFTAERYFLAYPDPAISKLSVELISNRYQLSKYHSKSQKIVTDEERLYELVPALMINFKYAIVSEELKHMMSALQDPAIANDEEKCNAIMKRYSEMREVQSIMAKRLGDRVVLP